MHSRNKFAFFSGCMWGMFVNDVGVVATWLVGFYCLVIKLKHRGEIINCQSNEKCRIPVKYSLYAVQLKRQTSYW